MTTLFIDASRYATPRDLHAALKAMLSLPVARSLAAVCTVAEDLGGTVKEI